MHTRKCATDVIQLSSPAAVVVEGGKYDNTVAAGS